MWYKCIAITIKGKKCKNIRQKDSEFCRIHNQKEDSIEDAIESVETIETVENKEIVKDSQIQSFKILKLGSEYDNDSVFPIIYVYFCKNNNEAIIESMYNNGSKYKIYCWNTLTNEISKDLKNMEDLDFYNCKT